MNNLVYIIIIITFVIIYYFYEKKENFDIYDVSNAYNQQLFDNKNVTYTGKLTVQGNVQVNGQFNLIPSGIIMAWSGSGIPSGWSFCDGTNGTPDLRSKFIVSSGQGSGLSNYSNKQTGGNEKITMSVEQMPPHSHGYYYLAMTGNGDNIDGRYWCPTGVTGTTQNTGGGQPFDIRPPFYALAWIMKT
jgi:microcystin-dependent protein